MREFSIFALRDDVHHDQYACEGGSISVAYYEDQVLYHHFTAEVFTSL